MIVFFYVRDDSSYFTAEIAQLVEHNLAKVGVASSSLVFRSTKKQSKWAAFFVEINKSRPKRPHSPLSGVGGVNINSRVIAHTVGSSLVFRSKSPNKKGQSNEKPL